MDSAGLPRRTALLAGGLAAFAAGTLAACTAKPLLPAGSTRGRPEPAAPNPAATTPAAAYARLVEGNARWVDGSLRHPDRDPTRRQLVAQSQTPFAVVLSCIDSRVPPELLFDTGLGDMYVLRTGGQTLGPVVTGSVEYGPMTSATPLVLVLGHQRCGAIDAAYKAARDGKALPGNLEALAKALRPAYEQTVKEGGPDPVDRMIRAQVRLTADELRGNADLAPLVRKGTLAVVGAYYSLDTGRVEVLTGAPPGGTASPGTGTTPEPSGTPAGTATPSRTPAPSGSTAPTATGLPTAPPS
ncbi:carbonic anhydrase [Streptomyces sp. NPDC089915]|uniref:carbonic anhydrase n=1 Tax=Streptomyces sp. NPDC089915 TaxID=3155186 RepID=UPI0034266C62